MAKHALVTGGAGFIGSHLAAGLLQDGWQVRILDNFSTGSRDNLQAIEKSVEVIDGEVRDAAVCRKACSGIDSVFHLAAIASVPASIADPAECHGVTFGGTLNMLVAARDQGVRRFVFSSSASVYGNADTLPTRESQGIQPESPYASDKACGEFYCRNFHSLYGLEAVILRYFNVFGPRQSPTSGYAAVIPRFVQAVTTGAAPVIYGDGLQTRDFVCVDNVVRANIAASSAEQAAGNAFNIAGGTAVSLHDVLDVLARISGKSTTPEYMPARSGEVRHSFADISAARSRLGYEPLTSLVQGLEMTMASACGA